MPPVVKVLLATCERRARSPFLLKNPAGHERVGTMVYNTATGRHELWLSLADFLRFSEAVARAGRIIGNLVKVAELRIEPAVAAKVIEMGEISIKTPFFTLLSIAKKEGVNITGLKGAKAVFDAITEARAAKQAA